jgi:hypothetical protein
LLERPGHISTCDDGSELNAPAQQPAERYRIAAKHRKAGLLAPLVRRIRLHLE